MNSNYFHKVHAQTSTRFWINNPSAPELRASIEAGAVSCTTNPAYCAKLLKTAPDYLHALIDRVITETRDDDEAAARVYREAAALIMRAFLPAYKESGGKAGFVTIQDDPRRDQDTQAVIDAIRRNRQLGPNYMAKIPVIPSSIEAIEWCVAENIPICATEVFSLSQAAHVCDVYERAARRTGNQPAFYVTHITGIFDEYLSKVAKRERIDIAPDVLRQAGCIVARAEYNMLKQRGYKATMLGGGVRGTHHFTEFVGGDVHVTMNWSTAVEMIEAAPRVQNRIDTQTPPRVTEELLEKLPDFAKAIREDGLEPAEYTDYGPVRLFRNSFLSGYYTLLAEVTARRSANVL